MSKLHHRKFARFFPSYHPRAGEPTYFIEKIWASLGDCYFDQLADEDRVFNPRLSLDTFEPKHHTIRAGHHVKVGDFIRPSVWSGKPYNSKQIIIGPDIEVVKTWDIEFRFQQTSPVAIINGNVLMRYDDFKILAANDGLSASDLMSWFNKPFSGQIICWSKDVTY